MSEGVVQSGMRVVSTSRGRIRLRALTPPARARLASVTEVIGAWPGGDRLADAL